MENINFLQLNISRIFIEFYTILHKISKQFKWMPNDIIAADICILQFTMDDMNGDTLRNTICEIGYLSYLTSRQITLNEQQ